MKGKSSINLASLVEFERHSMAETIRNENEEKKIKVKAPITAKKNKQHQTSNCTIQCHHGPEIFTVYRSSLSPSCKNFRSVAALVTEILTEILRHIA